MKHLIIFPILLVFLAIVAQAEIYTWTDDQGMVTFTDDSSRIPTRYFGSRKNGEIISIQAVKPQKSLKLRRNTKLQAAVPENRVKTAGSTAERRKHDTE